MILNCRHQKLYFVRILFFLRRVWVIGWRGGDYLLFVIVEAPADLLGGDVARVATRAGFHLRSSILSGENQMCS